MRFLMVLALVSVTCVALASIAHAADYGRWRVTASGHLTESWQSAATTPCAITGHGGADLSFKTPSPVTVHLRRKGKRWTARSPIILRFDVTATVSGDAVQQPPSSDETCQWPS